MFSVRRAAHDIYNPSVEHIITDRFVLLELSWTIQKHNFNRRMYASYQLYRIYMLMPSADGTSSHAATSNIRAYREPVNIFGKFSAGAPIMCRQGEQGSSRLVGGTRKQYDCPFLKHIYTFASPQSAALSSYTRSLLSLTLMFQINGEVSCLSLIIPSRDPGVRA